MKARLASRTEVFALLYITDVCRSYRMHDNLLCSLSMIRRQEFNSEILERTPEQPEFCQSTLKLPFA